uniref:Family with sequence similarity 83 member A n=1 Tax=Geospiza parvula TaxID=87175 RepID=A0A8C3Q4T5_GEOPR
KQEGRLHCLWHAYSLKLTKVDFSHNESIRLATDAFLDGGTDSYRETLSKEGEVDFLSSVEAQYIKDNARESYYAQESPGADGAAAPKQNDAGSLPSGTYFPTISDSSEPALLHTWITAEKPYLKEKSTATVYFQTEKNSNIRDIIRRYIHKTTQVLAIVMDVFTDTEILCDLLEAANKRMVFVYLLLDHSSVDLFSEMCDKLQISEDLFKNISVRSVTGEVYCAKSGRKFSGKIQEKFLISDWRYVLSGSYSFTWLCGQVHRNLLSKFTGQVVELFDEEFRHLYALSKPVRGPKTPPRSLPFLFSRSWQQDTFVLSSNIDLWGTVFGLAGKHRSCHSTQSSLLELYSKDGCSQGFLGRGLVPLTWTESDSSGCGRHIQPTLSSTHQQHGCVPAHLVTNLQSYQHRAAFLMQSTCEGSDWKMKLS